MNRKRRDNRMKKLPRPRRRQTPTNALAKYQQRTTKKNQNVLTNAIAPNRKQKSAKSIKRAVTATQGTNWQQMK